MGKVIALASMSLDGYTAKDDNTIGRLFDWLQNGEVEFTTATEGMTVNLSPQSARHWEQWVSSLGALVCGRTLFDFTDGWGGLLDGGDRVTHLRFPVTRPGAREVSQ